VTDAAAERRRKVEALAVGGATPGERAAASAASARLADKMGAAPQATDMASEVLSHLVNLGYRLISAEERHPRRHFIETDDGLHHLVTHLRAVTTMSELPDPADWFRRLLAGRKIMLPEQHPSGFRTNAAPYENVQQMGSGMASHVRTR